jgi:nicotinamidase-related amidase
MTTALLLLNAQDAQFAPEPIHEAGPVRATLQDLIRRAYDTGAPVLFVRDSRAGEASHPGAEIPPDLQPERAAAHFDADAGNAFLRSGLAPWLVANGIDRLIVAGFRTEYSVDSTVRAAHGLGYPVVLVANGHSTIDSPILNAAQIIAHHTYVLRAFAAVIPASEIDFATAAPSTPIEGLTPGDAAAIRAGLAEWAVYERWLSQGEGAPYWPHTHPARVADTLHQLWDPAFKLRGRYTDPPPWEMGIARTFIQPLRDTPLFVRKQAVQSVTKAFDHLLQNPRNPLSPHITHLTDNLYSYDARDIRLIYVPHVTTDINGRERRYIFLLWAAPGVPERNPFAF